MQQYSQDDLSALWRGVREELQASVPESTYRLWLAPLRAAGIQGTTLYLSAPASIRTWVERRYADLIVSAARGQLAGLRAVSFVAPPSGAAEAEIPGSPPNPAYSFERFVIGPGNRLAHAAALKVAEAPGEAYNPLFIHGAPGLGKTHLLAAIANYLLEHSPGTTVRLETAERFTNDFVSACRTSGTEAFKERHREIDVLLIDDVQFLEEKAATEEEFFHTFNALHEAGSQIVLSSDRPPAELHSLARRLRDRFEWGLIAEVAGPDLSTRLTVLRRLSGELAPDVTQSEPLATIAERVTANVRQLEGALTRILAFSSVMRRPIDVPLVEEVLGRKIAPRRPAPISVERIQEAVCRELAVPREGLLNGRRTGSLVRARQLAMYLTRELTDLSLPAIGRAFGGRDHSTVLNATRRMASRLESDPASASLVDRLTAELTSNPDTTRS